MTFEEACQVLEDAGFVKTDGGELWGLFHVSLPDGRNGYTHITPEEGRGTIAADWLLAHSLEAASHGYEADLGDWARLVEWVLSQRIASSVLIRYRPRLG